MTLDVLNDSPRSLKMPPHHPLMLPPIPQFTMPVYTLDMMGLVLLS